MMALKRAAMIENDEITNRAGWYLETWGAWAASGDGAAGLGYGKNVLALGRGRSVPVDSVALAVESVLHVLSDEYRQIAVLVYQRRWPVGIARARIGLGISAFDMRIKALKLAVYAGVENSCIK